MKLQSSGLSNKLFARSISLRRAIFLARNLTYHLKTQSIITVDIASHYKEDEAEQQKTYSEFAKALQSIYKRSPLT